jgi:hypothetical protein
VTFCEFFFIFSLNGNITTYREAAASARSSVPTIFPTFRE